MNTATLFPQAAIPLAPRASAALPASEPLFAAPMHIPDGFLSTPVSLLLWVVAVFAVGYALTRVERDLDDRKVPLMGVMAAAIFAGQMLNFAVAAGTSGHLMGAALATIVLGPWAAVLVMTAVVGTQALLFQDGGLLALGANIVNMGVVGVAVSYAVYRPLRGVLGDRKWSAFASGFGAAWLSIVLAALFVGLQLAVSGTSPANFSIPAMGGIHMLIGIGEGLITVGALALLSAARPDLVEASQAPVKGGRLVTVAGFVMAVLLAVASPLASAYPDGLEWVADRQGFMETARDAPYEIFPDYVFPGIADERLATIVAGIVGLVIVFGVSWAVSAARARSRSSRPV